jgi:hypothetical protein
MGRKIIHPEADLLYVRIMLSNKFLDKRGPINFCPLLRACGMTVTSSWFKSQKNVCCPLSLRRCRSAQRLPRCSWERSTNFTKQLGRQFLSTHVGRLRVLRVFIEIYGFLPVADKGGLLGWRTTPGFLWPRLPGVFFHVRRMLSWETEATLANATMLSASIRKVHLSCPAGA